MDLNIRNFPEKLAKQAKIKAVRDGVTLREFIIQAIEGKLRKSDAERIKTDNLGVRGTF